MPKGEDWYNFMFVNLAFILLFCANVYFIYIADIKKNWPLYRCNPMYMPLSDNITQDFTQCVQTIQTGYIGKLLEPVTKSISDISLLSNVLGKDIGSIFGSIMNLGNFLNTLVDSIKALFANLILEFVKLTFSIKDMIGKLIGVVVIIVNILDSLNKTAMSLWNGPPGKLVKGLGSCFHPDTRIRLRGGKIKPIKDLRIDDELAENCRVFAVLTVKNTEPLYVFKKGGVGGDDIFVTGSHKVFENGSCVHVRDHWQARKQSAVTSETYTCLITTNNRIKIEGLVFWDWEDDFSL